VLAIKVSIVRWASDDFPGIVECHLIDRFGKSWRFVEKVPVVTEQSLGSDSQYPQPGVIACQVTSRGQDGAGRETAEVDTSIPWGIASVEGASHFEVFGDQVDDIRDH
jgi:hypothetical protein